MPTETAPNSKFQIGHVLFMDVVGYSKLLIDEQTKLILELKDLVQRTVQFRKAQAKNCLLRLATGDGMALVFRDSPESPAHCALEINRAVQKHGSLPLRMGIHSGPVNEITDVNNQTNVAGAGINIAQRVMDCGDAGHILLSKHVAEDLEHHARWRPLLHDLGECEVKHGLRLGLFNLYDSDAGNSQLPESVRRIRKKQAASSALVFSTTIGLTVLIAGGTWFLATHLPKQEVVVSKDGIPASENLSATPASGLVPAPSSVPQLVLTNLEPGRFTWSSTPPSPTTSHQEKLFAGTWRGTIHSTGPQSVWNSQLELTIDETETRWGEMKGGSVFCRGRTLAYKRSNKSSDGGIVEYHATLIVHDDNKTATYTTSEKRIAGKWRSSTFGKGTLERVR